MNNRQAKAIRRLAEKSALSWYKGLLPDSEETEQLTIKMVKQYIPKVDYYLEDIEVTYNGQPYIAQTIHVSEGTMRWFYKQEKKRWR